MTTQQQELDAVRAELQTAREQFLQEQTRFRQQIDALEQKEKEIVKKMWDEARAAIKTEFEQAADSSAKATVILKRLQMAWPECSAKVNSKWIKVYSHRGAGYGHKPTLVWNKGIDPETGNYYHTGKHPAGNVFDPRNTRNGVF